MTQDINSRCFICTLGFTEGFILAIIPKYGLLNNDKLILLTAPDPMGKANNTKLVISKLIDSFKLTGGNVLLKTIELNELEFENNVIQISNIIREEKLGGRDIIINLSGGMRILVIATYLASLIASKYVSEIVITPESQKEIRIIPTIDIGHKITEDERKILEMIEKSESIDKISERVNKSKSTIYRIINKLEVNGFLNIDKNNISHQYELTLKAKISFFERDLPSIKNSSSKTRIENK